MEGQLRTGKVRWAKVVCGLAAKAGIDETWLEPVRWGKAVLDGFVPASYGSAWLGS